jgi:hypothetical protein
MRGCWTGPSDEGGRSKPSEEGNAGPKGAPAPKSLWFHTDIRKRDSEEMLGWFWVVIVREKERAQSEIR